MKKKYTQVIEIEECKQAVMLARVSSRKQERGASLNAQVESIKEYCQKNGFTIIEPYEKAFVFTESSTRGRRKKFKEMIEFIEKQKHKTATNNSSQKKWYNHINFSRIYQNRRIIHTYYLVLFYKFIIFCTLVI